MTNDRLNGGYVHRNLTKQLDLNEIIDNFAREHPRRMEILNIPSDEVETV